MTTAASSRCATITSSIAAPGIRSASGVAYNTAVHLTGPYKIENLRVGAHDRRHQQGPERPLPRRRPAGSGLRDGAHDRPRGPRRSGLEPAEVRRRNMIRADEMPYRVGIPYRDGEPIVYDSGDYPAALRRRSMRSAASRLSSAARSARARQAAISGSASAATSRAPVSGRSKARLCASIRPARSMSRPAHARRARAWRRSSRRSWRIPGRSSPKTSLSPCRHGGDRDRALARWQAAARSRCRRRFMHASERLRDKVFAIAANLLECAASRSRVARWRRRRRRRAGR